MLCPKEKYFIKCPYTLNKVEGITIHNTANDASARNEIKYMIENNKEVSFHFAVDDKEIVQGIPENRNAWHAGDDEDGKGNRTTLSIEICYSKSGGDKFLKAEKLTAKFVAYLLKKYGLTIEQVYKHQDWNGKYCPHRTLDMGWNRFIDMIKKELESSEYSEEELKMIEELKNRIDNLEKRVNALENNKPIIEQPAKKTDEIVYIVKKGDTLSKIAKDYKTTVDKLAKDNNIKNVNLIYVGQKIIIKG